MKVHRNYDLHRIGLWCNGSTRHFGRLSPGSNPGSPTTSKGESTSVKRRVLPFFSPRAEKRQQLKKLLIETYGCQMNVADSEVVASVMVMAGYEVCDTIDQADAVLLNTCSVRDNAEQKIYSRLEYLHSIQRRRSEGRLIIGVIGCMAERVREALIEQYGVDLVVGPDGYMTLPDLFAQVECGQKAINVQLSTTETYGDVIPRRLHASHIGGYVSIMRGCNNFCHYCIVP